MKTNHPPGAELQLNTRPADWIQHRVLPWGPGVGTRVCTLVPTDYDAYVRIVHPAEDPAGAEPLPVRWDDLARRSGRPDLLELPGRPKPQGLRAEASLGDVRDARVRVEASEAGE